MGEEEEFARLARLFSESPLKPSQKMNAPSVLDPKERYLQIAFNQGLGEVRSILPTLPTSNRILVEAGTPFLKREGMRGLREMRQHWNGHIVADLKTMDGAEEEVEMAVEAGATAVTALGAAAKETLDNFVAACKRMNAVSMIDMLNVEQPLRVLTELKAQPEVVILHKGRDEESSRGKVIRFKHIKQIKSKYGILISAAGGVDLKTARSAIFNGASIVVTNLVRPSDPWVGISTQGDVAGIAEQFLKTIE